MDRRKTRQQLPSPRSLATGLLAAAVLGLCLPASAAKLRYAEDRAPGIVNPFFTTTMSEARINELLFQGLYTDNEDLASAPLIADEIEVAANGMSAIITLSRGVTWQDGRSVQARDVVFTIETMTDRNTLATEAGRASWIEGAEVIDDYTVELTFSHVEASPQDKLHFKILPEHAFSGNRVTRAHPFKSRPVGTGPYLLSSYNDDNSITFERNPDYPSPVGIAQVEMREHPDKTQQTKMMNYGSIEALVRVQAADLARLQGNREVELYPYQTNSWWYVGFNTRRQPVDDLAVRQAITAMIDIEALMAPIGTGQLLSGPFVRSSPYYNHDVDPSAYDPFQAGALLESAGYFQEATGWYRDGEPLSITVVAPMGSETVKAVMINLQSQLRNQGIDITADFLDEAEWKARVWREHNYDLALSQWSFDRNEDIRDQFHSAGARNFGGYENERVDQLLDRARDSADPYEKKALLRQAHQHIHDDAPMVFLWTLDSHAAFSTRVSRVVVHPFYFFTFVSEWQMR